MGRGIGGGRMSEKGEEDVQRERWGRGRRNGTGWWREWEGGRLATGRVEEMGGGRLGHNI